MPLVNYWIVLMFILFAYDAGHQGRGLVHLLQQIHTLPAAERTAAVDAFLAQHPHSPVCADDSTAIFFYRGPAFNVAVAGDAGGWRPMGMIHLADTDFWYRIDHFEPKARLDYKLVLNDSDWVLDPRNPNQAPGGFGPNSELVMPGYKAPRELKPRASVKKGALVDTTIESAVLGHKRRVQIYLPAGYKPGKKGYPLALFTDGGEFISLGSVQTSLDNLIAAKKIKPLIAVFETPRNRNQEYGGSRAGEYEAFIANELIPFVESQYDLSPNPAERAIVGASLGGLVATQIAYNNPGLLGCCAALSPAYWYNEQKVHNQVVSGEKKEITFYMDWGVYEPESIKFASLMKDNMVQLGYNIEWNIWPEGHSWGSWRAHVIDALLYFFPPKR